jgi:hypothetical protein
VAVVIFASVVEGLTERASDGTMRAIYCADLIVGAELQLVRMTSGRIGVWHADRDIGRVPERLKAVVQAIADGHGIRCTVLAVETGGLFARRARRVEIEIEVIERAATLVAAATRLAAASGDAVNASLRLGRDAADLTADGARYAVDGTVAAAGHGGRFAGWAGRTLVTWGLQKPAAALGRGVDGLTDATIRRPVRAVRRVIRNTFLAAVTILVLILAIVVVWRLPTLPGIGSVMPPITSR